MDLEIVRTVLKNDVNEISVCADRKCDTGVFYTVISIFSRDIRRFIVEKTANERLFEDNDDYVGSFSYRDSLNLVFRFREESLLRDKRDLYIPTFAKHRDAALSLLAACGAAGMTGCLGILLFAEENINLSPDGRIYFNYFLNFQKLDLSETEQTYYRKVAVCAYNIVSLEYWRKYEGDVERFPSELQVFYKKAEGKGFTSYGQIIAFLRAIPDFPQEPHFGFRRVLDWIGGWVRAVMKHSMLLFVSGILLVTICYSIYQISIRVTANKSKQDNTTYVGMDTIGEIYLGEEDV